MNMCTDTRKIPVLKILINNFIGYPSFFKKNTTTLIMISS